VIKKVTVAVLRANSPQIIDAHDANVGIFFNIRWFARMEKIMQNDVMKKRGDQFKELKRLFYLIIRKFFDCAAKKNNLAYTELILNTQVNKLDSLTDSYSTWNGILQNYETPEFRAQFAGVMANQSYNEMLQKKKDEKKSGLVTKEWSAEETEKLTIMYNQYKSTVPTKSTLLSRLAQELTLNRRDVKMKLESLGLIDPPKQLTIKDLDEKFAVFMSMNVEQASLPLAQLRQAIFDLTAELRPIVYEVDFGGYKNQSIIAYMEVLKCLGITRLRETNKKGKAASAAQEVEQEIDAEDVEDRDDSSGSKWKFSVPTSAVKHGDKFDSLFSLSEEGLQKCIPVVNKDAKKTAAGAGGDRKIKQEPQFPNNLPAETAGGSSSSKDSMDIEEPAIKRQKVVRLDSEQSDNIGIKQESGTGFNPNDSFLDEEAHQIKLEEARIEVEQKIDNDADVAALFEEFADEFESQQPAAEGKNVEDSMSTAQFDDLFGPSKTDLFTDSAPNPFDINMGSTKFATVSKLKQENSSEKESPFKNSKFSNNFKRTYSQLPISNIQCQDIQIFDFDDYVRQIHTGGQRPAMVLPPNVGANSADTNLSSSSSSALS